MEAEVIELTPVVLTEIARSAAENIDRGRYVIGECANTLETKYNDHDMATFAKDINVGLKRVYEYAGVTRFYSVAREDILKDNPSLSYSHLRLAQRLKSLDKAREFLEECADNFYTVEEATLKLNQQLGKPTPPEKIVDMQCMACDVGQLVGNVMQHHPGTRVHVVVKKVD